MTLIYLLTRINGHTKVQSLKNYKLEYERLPSERKIRRLSRRVV